MPWTAPSVERLQPPPAGDERETLAGFLEFHRTTFLWKCSGLTGEQLATRPVTSSVMSLLGLVRHLTDVERYWFREIVARQDVDYLYWGNPGRDSDFDDVDPADAGRDYRRFLDELAHSRDVQRETSLDELVGDPKDEVRNSFRWVMVHLIEEYARHNGHADLFREAIDGATGE